MRHSSLGISAIEAVIGISLLALVLLFSIDTIGRFVRTGAATVEKTQALYLTEEMLEAVKFIRDTRWATFQSLSLNQDLYITRSGSTMSITTTPQPIDVFTPRFRLYAVYRDAVSDDIVATGGVLDPKTRLMVASTTWSGGEVALSQYVTDFTP